jgi:alpha-1,2-mannosyltransferase
MGAIIVLGLIAAVSLSPVLGSYLLRLLLRTVGDHLRRKTSARRDLIFQRVELDEQQLQSRPQPSQRTEDEDWERVESYAAGTAANGVVPDGKDFAGVVGFFHPFWYG